MPSSLALALLVLVGRATATRGLRLGQRQSDLGKSSSERILFGYHDIGSLRVALNSVIKVSFNLGVLFVGAALCRPSKERCHFHRNKVPALIVRCCFRRCCCCCCCCRRCHPHTWPSSSAVMVEEVRHVKRHQHVCVQLVFSVFSPPSHRA